NTSVTDINLLASHRKQANSNNGVSIDFSGLAKVFVKKRKSSTPEDLDNRNVRAASIQPMAPPPRMELGTFITLYSLSPVIHQRLMDMDIAGPHTLRRMDDKDLLEGSLSKGQIASVRDAEDRYLHDSV
ncbi:hypothetical protein C8J56DRAFT_798063, partial [Mycena floridula]